MFIRIQKYLSHLGVCSRRTAEKWIEQGKIKLNDKTVTEMGILVDPKKDNILIKGKPLKTTPLSPEYIIYNKPKGVVCTTRHFKNQKNIFEILPFKKKLIIAGRLDQDTEGLVLLTHDGALAHQLTHPRFKRVKKYEVITHKPINVKDLIAMKKGILIKKVAYKIADFILHSPKKCGVTLKQGKKREIRILFQHQGYSIQKLKRVQLHTLKLGKLKTGEYRRLSPKEIKKLKLS